MTDKEARLEELIVELERMSEGKESIDITDICEEWDMEQKTERYFLNIKNEEKILVPIKELLINYYDELLAEGTIEAWEKIIIWYQKIGIGLASRFWEFSILRTILLIYKAEYESSCKNGTPVSVLQFSNMYDIHRTYFEILFLCRRMEYGITDGKELMELIHRRKLSLIFVNYIIERARVYNKDKVRNRIDALMGEYGSR